MYEIGINNIIRSFDFGKLMKSKSELEFINDSNVGKFLQDPEEILFIDREDLEASYLAEEDRVEKKEKKKSAKKSKAKIKKQAQQLKVSRKIGSVIPKILKKAFPNLNYDAYRKMKGMKNILKQTLPICEECYLYHTRLNSTAGTRSYSKFLQIVGETNYFGTGRLRPEILRLRLKVKN